MSPGETTLHMPVKKISEDDQCVENPLDNTSDEVPKLQVEESTSFWAKLRSPSTQCASRWTTSARWTSFCMHLGLVPSRNKHAKMSPRGLGVLIMEPSEKCVRR